MAFWNILGKWWSGGLRRDQGVQEPGPGAYSQTSADPVTFDSAMQLSAVWACVKLLAETIASLPLTVYKVTSNGRKIAENHELTTLFSGKVNRYQTKVEFFETVALNLIITGNAYCKILRAGGRVVGLLPLMSSQVETRLLADGSVVHAYAATDGIEVYAPESIWHLKLMGNGIVGMSPLDYQRNTLGIAQAAEGAVTKIYRNGAKPSGVLKIDKFLTPDQRAIVRNNFYGLSNGEQERLLVLEGGMDFAAVSLSPQDIELLQSRRFQIAEICRWYGIPSVMVNDSNGSSVWGSGIEQIVQGFYKLTLRPILEKIEASMVANLMAPGDARKYEVEFNFEGLLRGDMKSRFESYRVGIQGGFLKPNEVRAYEGLDAAEGGDNLFIQGATVPITEAGMQQPAPVPVDNSANDDKSFKSQEYKQQPNLTLEIKTDDISASIKAAVQQIAAAHADKLKEMKDAMDVTINIPEQKLAPIVVQVPETVVNVRNDVRPSEIKVIDNHPTVAIQTVERNERDEVERTVTRYVK